MTRLLSDSCPIFPGLEEAPITAIDLGLKKKSRSELRSIVMRQTLTKLLRYFLWEVDVSVLRTSVIPLRAHSVV